MLIEARRCAVSIGALLASAAWIVPAYGQSALDPPPIRSAEDANHVDLTSGSTSLTVPDLSIGDSQSSLSHSRTRTKYGWWDNNVIYATLARGKASLSAGSNTRTYTRTGSNYYIYSSDQGDGSQIQFATDFSSVTLTDTQGNQTLLTVPDPNSAQIQQFYGAPVGNSQIDGGYIATRITKTSGEVILFSYTENSFTYSGANYLDYRLQGVTSSRGYQLKYAYASDITGNESLEVPWNTIASVTAINNAVDYCDPSANHCTGLTRTWPSVSYAKTTSGTNTLETVTDSLGRVTRYTTSASNLLIGIKRPASSSDNLTYAFDTNNRVHTVTRDGQTWTYNWSLSGTTLTATVTDPLSHTEVTTADTGKLVLLTFQDGNGHITTYQYDTQGRLTYLVPPEGTITSGVPTAGYTKLTYDSRNNITELRKVAKSGLSAPDIVGTAVYPSSCTNAVTCNEPTSVTDARGNTTGYTYDPTTGMVATITQPAVASGSPTTTFSYSALQAYYKNSAGSIVASGSPIYVLTGTSICKSATTCTGTVNEVRTTIGYGPQTAGTANNLLPVSQTVAAGNGSLSATTGTSYDAIGNPIMVTDPLGHVTNALYDADRELTESIGPDPDGSGTLKNRARRITYNADGLVTLVEQGTASADGSSFATLQQVATTYDSADRKIADSAQAGGTTYALTQYSYDAASRLQCTTQRMNPAVFASLPSSACTLGTTGSYGPDRITYNTYDAADQLTKVTTGYGVSGLQRDETTYTYSNDGKVTSLKDANVNLTTYVYDGFDRLVKTQYPSPTKGAGTSSTTDYEQLTLDANGNVTSRRLRDGTSIAYGYDALNRMSSKTLPSPEHAVTYAYDNLAHPTTITGATALTYGWDALGRMTSETQPFGSVAYQYDLANRRTRLTWQDGIYLTYDYDAVDEMAHIYENGTTALVSFNYDDLGNRIKRTLATGSITTYGYDPVSRLTSMAITGGTNTNTATLSNYSPAGEIGSRANSNDAFAWTAGITGSKAYTINGLNQFATVAGAAQGYDGKGNLTSSGGLTSAYWTENMLKSVSNGTTLYYDPLNRLTEYDTTVSTRFVYDGGQMSEEIANPSGAVLRRYVFGPAGDEPIVWYEGSGTTAKRYIDQDERGSVTRITDSTGATIAVNSYDEYGIPGSANQSRFGYTGQAWLPEIGLAYYKARFYSPTLGRFLQTDPIGYADGPNWYNYVGSDPVNGIDPAGMEDVVYPEIPVHGVRPTRTGVDPSSWMLPAWGRTFSLPTNYLQKATSQQNKNKGCPPPPSRAPHGLAIFGGANASGGVGVAGGILDGSVGAGFFGRSFGAFGSYAASLFAGSHNVSAPSQRSGEPVIAGAYAGLGGGALVTNATNVSQLSGPFTSWIVNTPVGSVNFSYSGDIWTASLAVGPGALASGGKLTTTTKVLAGGCR